MNKVLKSSKPTFKKLMSFSFAFFLLAAIGCQSEYDRGYSKGEDDASSFTAECGMRLGNDSVSTFKWRINNTKPKNWPDQSTEYNQGYKKGWSDYLNYMNRQMEQLEKQW